MTESLNDSNLKLEASLKDNEAVKKQLENSPSGDDINKLKVELEAQRAKNNVSNFY